jgi:riboflavin synthase alpha subunit
MPLRGKGGGFGVHRAYRRIGLIEAAADGRLVVRAPHSAARLEPGGSLCVSGVRLTAEHVAEGLVAARLSEETRRRSACLVTGRQVNVETPLALGDRLGGHLVQGHADAVGKVVRVEDEGVGRRIRIRPRNASCACWSPRARWPWTGSA